MNATSRGALVLACLSLCTAMLHAQPAPFDPALDPARRAEIIDGVLARLEAHYVYPETALAMSAAVRARAQAGAYNAITDARVLADTLTAHLRAVSHDKHLSVQVSPRPIPEAAADPATDPELKARREMQMRFMNYGFEELRHLKGNVGYLKLKGFAPADGDGAREAVAQAMGFLSRTDALIIDLRDNQGGEPAMVQLLASYFFGETPVHLNSLYWRPDDRTEEFWTHATLDGPRYGPDRPVYVLTSRRTFSAAEEFSYDLQQQGRATIVGETTGGGAHPGDVERVTEYVGVWVPSGRAINPVSGTNWEGVGVVPDVAVGEEKAFDAAYRAAIEALLARATHPALIRSYEMHLQELDARSDKP